ncbi:MAG: hypothetical protein MUO21_07325 [Nitrososphaeraceae archaeon]|nr:hypothetical protein [Nitrososphaeraceae archaeon]
MSKFIQNAHTVPLADLLTLNVLIIIAIVFAVKYYGYCDQNQCLILLGVLLVASIIIHPLMGIPDNLSYYFGFGDRPAGWRGV